MDEKDAKVAAQRRPLYAVLAASAGLGLLLLLSSPGQLPDLQRMAHDARGASGIRQRPGAAAGDSAVARVNASLVPALPYAPFGYHVDDEATGLRHIQRWGYIRSALVDLLATWHAEDAGADADVSATVARPFRAMDWGANQGYFSSGVLYTLPNVRVLSVDPDATYFGTRPLSYYRHRLHEPPFEPHHRDRAMLCKSKLTVEAIEHLAPHGALCPAAGAPAVAAPLDLQVTLSVFHWLDLADRTAFFRTLARHVRAARATVLELPEPGHNISANSAVFSRWYGKGDRMVPMVQQALDEHLCDTEGAQPCLLRGRVRLLGSNLIDYGANNPATTTREVLLITLSCEAGAAAALPQVAPASEAACWNWLEAAGCAHRLQHGSCGAGPTIP